MIRTDSELIRRVHRLMQCDTVRVDHFEQTPRMFLILGWKRRSEGEWFDRYGEPRNFDYLEERCLAMGESLDELYDELKRYRRLQRLERIKDPVKRVVRMLEVSR